MRNKGVRNRFEQIYQNRFLPPFCPYDHLGRQIQQNWLGAGIGGVAVNTITTTYNAAMRVASIADNDAVNTFTWDIMGRLLTSSNAGTINATPVTLTNSYDSLGRRSGLSANMNSVADFVNAYSYDTAGRMTQVTQTDGNSSAGDSIQDKRVDMVYDAAGRFTSLARYESLTTANPIASTNFSYDTAGRLTSLQHAGFTGGAAQSSSIAGYTYTWDAADRLTSMNSVRDGLSTYAYDATSQLTGADHTGQSDESFSYDANGNRISSSTTVASHNRILNDGTSVYEYDAEGNRTSKTDIATGHKVEYSWNHANQLIAVVYKTYNNTVTKSVEYQYDALGRRIGKSVDDNGDAIMDRRETFVYDGAGLLAEAAGSIHISGPNGALNQAGWTDQLLFQFTDADADSSSFSPLATRYLYGPAVDQIFAVESASSDPLWALTDHQGTPRDWVQQTTVNGNSSTTIAQHIRFTAFGTISSVVDSSGALLDARLSPLASYTGQLYDADADLMYYRARWYDPVLGKFLNDDPMGFAAGDANVSRYVRNAVLFKADATGLANTIVETGITGITFFIEWFPEKFTGELKILTRAGAELGVIKMMQDPQTMAITGKIVERHGNKILPGVSSSIMRKLNEKLAAELAKNAERLGGESIVTKLSEPLLANGRVGLGRLPPKGGSPPITGVLFAWLSMQEVASAEEFRREDYERRARLLIDPHELGIFTGNDLQQLMVANGFSPEFVRQHVIESESWEMTLLRSYPQPHVHVPTPIFQPIRFPAPPPANSEF